MRLSECRGQACLNYAEHEHLRRSQLEMRNCHTGCKNHETKKREELIELTVNNYSQPTTLPLRTYNLTTILPLRTQGALKEHQRSRGEKTISTKSMSSRSVGRCRRRRLIDVDDVDLEGTEGLY